MPAGARGRATPLPPAASPHFPPSFAILLYQHFIAVQISHSYGADRKVAVAATLRRAMRSAGADFPPDKHISSVFRMENCSYMLDIEAVCSSETSVRIAHYIWRHFLEGGDSNFLYLFLSDHPFLCILFVLFCPTYICSSSLPISVYYFPTCLLSLPPC